MVEIASFIIVTGIVFNATMLKRLYGALRNADTACTGNNLSKFNRFGLGEFFEEEDEQNCTIAKLQQQQKNV